MVDLPKGLAFLFSAYISVRVEFYSHHIRDVYLHAGVKIASYEKTSQVIYGYYDTICLNCTTLCNSSRVCTFHSNLNEEGDLNIIFLVALFTVAVEGQNTRYYANAHILFREKSQFLLKKKI